MVSSKSAASDRPTLAQSSQGEGLQNMTKASWKFKGFSSH